MPVTLSSYLTSTWSGSVGNQGIQGTSGANFNQGTQGTQGRQGIQGIQGISGTTFSTASNLQINSLGINTSPPTGSNRLDVNGNVTFRAASSGEGGQVEFVNPDNSTIGLVVDVSTADIGRVFQARNNSTLALGQLVGTGGMVGVYTAAVERFRLESAGTFSAVIPNGSTRYPAFWCRAWVNTGDGSVINGSGNVSSVSEPANDQKTINFTTAMPDANFSVLCTSGPGPDNNGPRYATIRSVSASAVTASYSDDASNNQVGITYWAIFR